LAADVKGGLAARLIATVLIFAGLEGLIFHSGLYARIIEPDSTTGFMELQIQNEIRRPKPNRNQVLAVGHSRMALLPRIANEMQPGTGYTFATIGLGGTTPRTWFYALRAVDPHAHNYAAILIPEDDYNEPDMWEDQSDRESDLHYVIARLRLRDLREFPWTYKSADRKWAAFEGIVLKGTVYKQDFQEFLDHPLARIAKAQYYRHDSAGWYYGFGGDARTLAGLEIDWAHKTARFPPSVPEAEQKRIAGNCSRTNHPIEGMRRRIGCIGIAGLSIITAAPGPGFSSCACRGLRFHRRRFLRNSIAQCANLLDGRTWSCWMSICSIRWSARSSFGTPCT